MRTSLRTQRPGLPLPLCLPLSLGALALPLVLAGCPWGFGDGEGDAGVPREGCFEGQIQLLGSQAAGAQAASAEAGATPDQIRHQRALVSRALNEAYGPIAPDQRVTPTVEQSLLPTARAPDLKLAAGDPPPVRPRLPEWAAGHLLVQMERGRFTAKQMNDVANQHLAAAGLTGVRAEKATCVARSLCRVFLKDEHGKLLDKAATKDVEQKLTEKAHDGVVRVAANYIHYALAVPNDTYYSVQRWHYEAPHLPAAWDITTGDPDMVVAVLDTGLNLSHPDLQGGKVAQGIDMISDPNIAGDGNERDVDATDLGVGTNYHGTHVAGTIGANSNNSLGAAGVLWQGQVQPIRVLGQGTAGQAFDIISGLYWAVGETAFENDDGTLSVPILNDKPARVVNLSLGAPFEQNDFNVWQEQMNLILVTDAARYGYPVVVVAAGNEDQPADNLTPGNVAEVLTVGSHRYDGQRASYSNWGNLVDVMGPGGQADLDQNGDGYPDGVLSLQANDYNFQQGTSMAAPHVAGIAALLLSVDPALTHQNVVQLLRTTANPQGTCTEGCGAGWIDAAAALLAAGGTVAETPYLSVDSSIVLFGSDENEQQIRLLNLGGADAQYDIEVLGPHADRFLVNPATGAVVAGGTRIVDVTLNRGALTSATATMQITGLGDAAGQQFFVDLYFNDRVVPPKFQINFVEVGAYRDNGAGGYVLVGETAVARRDALFQWEVCGLDTGDYFLFAVGDDNSDGVFDSQVESFGAWPFVSAPESIHLERNTVTSNVTFGLTGGFVLDGAGSVGSPCLTDDECTWAIDALCIVPGGALWQNGYCSRLCDDGYCGPGAKCAALDCGGEACPACLLTCTSSSQCRTGDSYRCDTYNQCTPEGFE